jgi:hypothetical protein
MNVQHCPKCGGLGKCTLSPSDDDPERHREWWWPCEDCGGSGHVPFPLATVPASNVVPIPPKEWPTGDGRRPSVTPAPVGVVDAGRLVDGVPVGVADVDPPHTFEGMRASHYAEGDMANGAEVQLGTALNQVAKATGLKPTIGRAYHLNKPPKRLGGDSHDIAAGDPVRFVPLPEPKEGSK